jgi:hypothetical protein
MDCTTVLSSCIALWLSSHGYTQPQADALLKQLWTESRFQPCVIARSGSSYLPQWAGERLRRVHARFGRGCPSWDKQLELIDWELRNEPAYQAFWSAPPGREFAVLRQTFGRGRRM